VALACYAPVCLVGPFVCVAVLALARRRAWLRSHAWQGLLLGLLAALAVVALWLGDFALEAAGLPSPGLVAVVLQLVVLAAYLAISIRLMLDAYRRREATLPLIGPWSRRGPAAPPLE
jgi:uncharacterized membrane protein